MVFGRAICVFKVSENFITVCFCLLLHEYGLNLVNEIIVFLGVDVLWKKRDRQIFRDFVELYL